MKKFLLILVVISCAVPIAAQAGSKLSKLTDKNAGKKIAVVSVSANNFGNSLQGWNKTYSSSLMASRLNRMLEFAEQTFSDKWQVVKASSFVKNPEFQKLAGAPLEVAVPSIDGTPLPLLADNRKELIKTKMSKDKAKAMASATGADFFAIIYSEWGVRTGRFVPTSKALSKNLIGIYNAKGKQVFFGRNDQSGKKTLGGMGRVVVDENSIDEWVEAYERGFVVLYTGKK